ncbi:hypothetical protein LOC71_07365 [Rhodopirellula sp. JC740]|uniref:EF-hand domain-containing protein n=1 Tax=Rhodopirellula halodulae TaxID=2894198 RepID=A0ABS8NGX7_9BACT|nr:EF-hand domain-containing protein [Rhodopirellula sp. JC740]MCC9642088.1 hypothetical protein [Rhodopirellula sp. JC740]
MKLVAAGFALPVVSSVANAQNPRRKGQMEDGAERRRGMAGQMDPSKIAARLIKEHDKDGDGALNEAELVAALTAMRNLRGQGMRGQGMRGRDGKEGGPQGRGRNVQAEDKGVTPKRPGQ